MFLRFLLAVLLFIFAACPLFAEPVKDAHVEAELVSETRSIRPGEAFWVALRLRADEGWHTYYKDPGDSGLATTLEWDLPPGFVAGPIQWPQPQKIQLDPLITVNAYEGETFLLTRISQRVPPVPGPSVPGTPVMLKTRAVWLACKDVCILGEANLVLELPVKDEEPVRDPRWSGPIASTRIALGIEPSTR